MIIKIVYLIEINEDNVADVNENTFNKQKNSLPANIRASDPSLRYSKHNDSSKKINGPKPKTHDKDSHDKNGSLDPFAVSVIFLSSLLQDFQTKFDSKYVKLGGLGFNKDDRWCDAKNRFDKMK